MAYSNNSQLCYLLMDVLLARRFAAAWLSLRWHCSKDSELCYLLTDVLLVREHAQASIH